MCTHGSSNGGASHWACNSCIDKSGRCVTHRCRVVPTGKLWARTSEQAKSHCPYGCPGIQADVVHACPRLLAGNIIFRDIGIFDTLGKCANALPGAFVVNTAVAQIKFRGPFETPDRVRVLLPTANTAMIIKSQYTHPTGPPVIQHALLLPSCKHDAPLFPPGQNFYSCSRVQCATQVVAHRGTSGKFAKLAGWNVDVLKLIFNSSCARRRWSQIMGSTPAPQMSPAPSSASESVSVPPRRFFNVQPKPARYRMADGKIQCLHCGAVHLTLARFVVSCAPEHSNILN